MTSKHEPSLGLHSLHCALHCGAALVNMQHSNIDSGSARLAARPGGLISAETDACRDMGRRLQAAVPLGVKRFNVRFMGPCSIHGCWAFLSSEVNLKVLVTPALWPAPDFQDSVSPGDKWSTQMSLSQWPALSGGSATTLDIELPQSFRGPFRGWSAAQLFMAMG